MSNPSRATCAAVVVAGILAATHVATAQQWPQFRGRNGGVADDHPQLPTTWSETENVVWAVDIPGQSWSSPIVWEDHVFITTAVSSGEEPEPSRGLTDPSALGAKSTAPHRWIVYDIDFDTGTIRWERELQRGPPPVARHARNSYASETPVTDGQNVYIYLGNLGLVTALNFSGETVWQASVEAMDDRFGWGQASSPALHDDLLVIVNDNLTRSYITAFNAATGEERWSHDRDEVEGWATPFIWQNDVRTEIVTAGMNRVRSYDLDGALLWELTGMSTGGPIPTPLARNELLYISSGYPGSPRRPVFAVRPGGSGDLSLRENETSNESIAWFQPRLGSYQTSGLAYGDHYYTLLDRGFLLCHDARTGEEVFRRQRIAAGTGFAASPWAYNDKVFLLSEDGDTYVVQAGPEFEILATNSLNEMVMATPAIAHGSLLVRTQSKLYRIQEDTPE